MPTDATELLAEVRARAAELISPRGEEIERTGRLPEDILEWIYDLKLFKLMVPAEFAGRPTPPLPELLLVFDELSAIDGSLGWLVHIGRGGRVFCPFVFRGDGTAAVSHSESRHRRNGISRRRSVRCRVATRSRDVGCMRAVRNTPHCLQPTHAARKTARKWCGIRSFFPIKLTVIDDWRAFGLKGTASNTFVVDDVFVPHERVFVVGDVK